MDIIYVMKSSISSVTIASVPALIAKEDIVERVIKICAQGAKFDLSSSPFMGPG